MDALRRTSTLRRVATTASLAALLIAPGAADAAKAKKKPKSPVITSVSPMEATVGDTLTIKGKNFRKGKGKNSVGFKRDGYAVVFLRSEVSTTRTMYVKLTSKLNKVLDDAPARFHLRVLANRFGKSYTGNGKSPFIGPREDDGGEGPTGPTGPEPTATATATATPTPTPTCAAGNSETVDTDGDLLSDALENKIGTAGCKADSDDDGVSDGYEYRSAIDLNDDEYQNPNQTFPYPADLPYPNPLSPSEQKDSNVDYDGDGLSLLDEYTLWMATTPAAERTLADPVPDGNGRTASTPLNYSDGLQYSRSHRCASGEQSSLCGDGTAHVGRRVPDLAAANYDRWNDFTKWAGDRGYATVYLHDDPSTPWYDHSDARHPYSILDVNLSGDVDGSEDFPLDRDNDDWLSDDERDEDADGLSNITEAHIEMRPGYWAGCYSTENPYPVPYGGTDLTKADTDGDGIRDGADDQDHDDFPNMMELSRFRASGFLDTEDFIPSHVSQVGSGPLCQADADLLKPVDDPDTPQDESAQPFPPNHPDAYGQVNPFNSCLPDVEARSCAHFYEAGTPIPAPFDGPHWWSLQ